MSVFDSGGERGTLQKRFDRVRDGSVSDRGERREEGQGCVSGFRSVFFKEACSML